ncbi:inactive histone-lysine N-methyltransferase 2E-like isoform X2 [Lineus longissimus]|uniref:inactive histone-lysine N-methyltransferase 2E-like isoform X2 n=1 Tax=Lineus longissimus TaxID=88925 RepID=UPI00315C8117
MSIILHVGSEKFSTHPMPAGTVVDQPESPKVLPEETRSHQPQQTYPGCYGLPYQDHNYGAPPPPTPPQSPPPTQAVARVPTPTLNHINGSVLDVEDGEPEVGKEKALESITDTINEVLNSVNIVEPSEPAVSHTIEEISADDDSVTRCICEYSHDDGYMICCDKCSVWQHIDCMGIDRNAIPDTYYCERCEPRPVDADKARDIQSRKREFLSDTSSSSETEIVTRYLDTSSGLNIIKKNGKKFRKKRKEKENDKLPKDDGESVSELPQVIIKPLLGQKKKKYKKFKKNKLKNENGVSLDKLEKVKKKLLKKQKENEQHIKKLKGSKLKAKKLKISRLNDYQPSANLVATPLNHNEDANPAWDRMDTDACKYVEALTNMYTADIMEVIASRKVNGTHPDSVEFRQQKDQLLSRLGYVTQVRSATSIYRKGLKAAEDLTLNQAVVEYRGMFMLRQQFDKEKFFWQKGMPFVLFYGKLDGLDICVDASTFGNEARFVRRSCTPNAEVRHFLENGKLHLLIFSLKEITKGAEITIPFDFNYQECNYNVECACSRNNCPVHKFFKKLESKKENNKLNNVIVKPLKKKKSKSLDHIVSDRSEASCQSNIHVASEESSAAGPAHLGKRKRVTPLQQSTNTNNINTVEEVAQTTPKQPPPPPPAPPPPNHDENSNIEIEVDGPSASPEAEVDHEGDHEADHEAHPSEDEGTSHDSKKKTREERKMEAIMKAFEKLEKREERRKEALARLDHGQVRKDGKRGDDSDDDDCKEDVKMVAPKSGKEHKEKVAEEVKVKVEREEVKESPVKVKIEEPPPPPPEVKVKEEVERPRLEKPKHKGKKGKKSTLTPARRRSRVSSLCSSVSENVVSPDESSNSTITSTPCTPLPSDPTINPFGQAFKFPKTKKHLMNEWLTEKGQDVNKPLSIKTDLEVPKDETMFVKYLPSPHSNLSHMRRNSTNTTPVASATVTTKTSSLGQSMGSAKKRWLRQAMFETDSDTSSSIPNGGSLSPNCTIPSPSQSPVIDFVTPLKKRRLAWRESQDGAFPPTPSTPSSDFAPPLDTPSSIINRSMSLDESKLRNGFSRVAFSPMTPVTPGVNLFEKIGALSSNTDMPGYNKQESMESDVSESLLSPHRERRLTGESDSDSLLQPDVMPQDSVNSCVNSASCAGLDNMASDVAMAEAEPSPSGSVDTVTMRVNDVLVSNLSMTGCANMEAEKEKMEECDTSGGLEDSALKRRSLEVVAESQGAEVDTDNSRVEASGSSKHLNNDFPSVVDSTPSEPSVQNVLVDSQGELSNCDADTKCESSVEPMEVCSASVSLVTNSDEKISGNADSTDNRVGLSRPERVATSEQTVSCSNGGSNKNSSESVGGMDSTEPTPGVSGVITRKKEDDSVSSSGSTLEEGEICDSDEEHHNEVIVSDSSQVPESQGFEYEVSESDARDVRTDNVVDTSTHQDTASTTNPDQSQQDQPNHSLQADSTSGIPDHKDNDATNNITSSTVSDSDGAVELNSQVSTTDNMDNSVVDTASSSQMASSSTCFISSSHASSLSTTTMSADSSPSNSNIGSSYSPLAGSQLTTRPTGVASSTHSPIRSMFDQPSSTSGPSPPGSASAASHSPIQQQKKKVSLLEYRKRMKEKSTGSSCNSASSTPTKTPTSISFGSPRVTTPTVSLAPLPLFESSSPGDVERSPFRDPADAKWSQPTSVERVREQSLAERLKREFGVDADDDDDEKKSECQARRRLPTTPPPPPPPSSLSSLSRGSLSAVVPHGVKLPLTDESPSTSNAELLKAVNPEILKAVAAVFKGAQISNKPRPSLGLPPGPQPVPPTSLAQAIAGANGTRSPAQAKLPSLMSMQTFTQGAQAQPQFNNFQTNGGPVPNQPFPQTPPIHQPQSFNQNLGPFSAGPAQAPGAASSFSPATPPVKYPTQAPSFNQNQAFNGQQNASFPPASSTTQPGQDQGFQGQTFQPNFPQGQFGPNNFNQQQQFGPNSGQFGAPPQNGQMVPPTSSSGPPQGWQSYNNFNNQSQVPPPPPPQKNSSGYTKQKYRKNSGGFSRDRSHHGHRD